MKIAFIAPSKVPSNTANSIQVMKVVQSFIELGHTAELWVPGDGSVDWQKLKLHYGLKVEFPIHFIHANPRLKRYDFTLKAVNAAKAWNARIIYTWMPQAAYFALRKGIPTIFESHDRPTGMLGPWLLRRITASKQPKKFAAITQALVHVLEKEFDVRIRPGDLVIAPDGVDLERYEDLPGPSEARKLLGLKDKPTAMYSGHLYAGRGMDLIYALAQEFPELQFLVVGGNPESVLKWQDKASQEEVKNLTLTGFVPNTDLALYQAAGDYLLMPYGQSVAVSSGGNTADVCSPMKMFEYMAVGRPILSSNLPVLREVLSESNAIFCETESVESWAAALRQLLVDPDHSQRLSLQALKDVRQYSWIDRAKSILEDWQSWQ
ncbi:MAG TPA: glycosyltransferase [Bellilinea sp.]|nr:glycosyltransferase [Bellilinea sp.]